MLENLSFTDAQGQSFTEAVVRVANASDNRTWNGSSVTSVALDLAEMPDTLGESSNDYQSENRDVSVRYYYWPTSLAYTERRVPYRLKAPIVNAETGETTSYVEDIVISKSELEKDEYKGLTLELICEKFFLLNILPNLN